MREKTWLVLFGTFTAFMVAVVIIANNGNAHLVFGVFEVIPHFDKVGHFVLMGALAFFAVAALAPRFRGSRRRTCMIILSVVAIVVALEELSQSQFANRTFSGLDLVFSLAGILCLGPLGLLVASRKSR